MHPGARLGVYELVEQLGAGGMGVVWRAHDRRLGRDVALKVLPPHLASHPESLVRFEREARGLAALSHPNIVSIFDLGDEHGQRYIVTELLNGQTLRDLLRRGPLPWRSAADLCATIADGLAAAHAKGILHRDLKPENIFLTSDDRVKILDFGLAKEVTWSSANATTMIRQTEPGRLLGTLGYTSPEQLRGEELDFASDIFSLGCVLYELMSGFPAFLRGSSAEAIAAILREEPPPLEPKTNVPPELARIVARCLEKRREKRFQSASDLAFALRHLTVSQPMPVVAKLRRRWLPAMGIAALVVISAGSYAVLQRPEIGQPLARDSVSLAVVPFTASAEFTWAGEGIAESIFRRLAPLRTVRVVARKTAANADANHILRGSIEGSGDEITVAAEVIATASGERAWTRTYTGTAGDLLTLQTQLSSDVERFLRAYTNEETAGARQTSSTVDAEAYREYLKGRHHWNKFTIDGFTRALEHFRNSIDRDPTYALAYAGLADSYSMLAYHGGNADEWMPKARAAAMRATELDPQLGEAWTSLGTVHLLYDWNWRGAEEALKRGVELNPRYATAHHAYALLLGVDGRADEALRELEIASELDPLSLVIYIDLAWAHYLRGDHAKAIEIIQRAVRHDPRSPLARYEAAWYLDHARRYAESIEMLETALKADGADPAPVQRLRDALQRGGPDAYLREKLALSANESHMTRAAILILAGDEQRALDEIEAAVRERERDVIYLKASPAYTGLRGEPRYEQVVRTVWSSPGVSTNSR